MNVCTPRIKLCPKSRVPVVPLEGIQASLPGRPNGINIELNEQVQYGPNLTFWSRIRTLGAYPPDGNSISNVFNPGPFQKGNQITAI